ncbi:MAG: hypothetical protein IIT46_01160 [Lachnospiraceae bacterium]|nr:hypothetical protein [Lachnospiraceae bacterium]
MRVTNMMMNTGMLNNIMSNKSDMSKKFDQYTTGQKIQKPSEDPVIAIRSLKYRANLTQIGQYLEKNVEDAYNWMNITESALSSMSSLLTNMYGYMNQGANDTYETLERETIVNQLDEYRQELYSLLNADNAGRYVFSGYRTDTTVCYQEEDNSKQYTITEPLTFANLFEKSYISGAVKIEDENTTAEEYAQNYAPIEEKVYCLNLGYKKLDNLEVDDGLVYKDEDGVESIVPLNTVLSTDKDAYKVEADEVRFVQDTGEIIFGKDMYGVFRYATSIVMTYKKSKFEENEVRPEMYYDCVSYEVERNDDGEITDIKDETMKNYQHPREQDICYNVSNSQSLKVNTLANQVMNSSYSRMIDNIINAVNDAYQTQHSIDAVELRLQDTNISDELKAAYEKVKEQLSIELALRKSILRDTFSTAMTATQNTQSGCKVADDDGTVSKIGVTIALTSAGTRYSRLQLIEQRLEEQQTSVTELLDSNESVTLEEAVINYNSAETTYTASLTAASKVVQNSLLDFL